jgi:2-iminobutanoate/2-iminopropanoate deaminase
MIIDTPKAAKPIRPYYSQAFKVKSDNLLFLSGQTGRTTQGDIAKGDIRKQTLQAIENINAILQEAGASIKDIVKLTIYLVDIEKYFDDVAEIRLKYFAENPPPATLVEVKRLALKDMLIEIDVIAAV